MYKNMYKFIIVDDEALVCSLLPDLLDYSKHNFEFCGAFDNAISALEYIKFSPVDLVICDIKMPKMSGLDFCHILSQDSPNTKIIVISAYRDFEYARRAIDYNAVAYISKPIQYDEYENAIAKARTALDNSKYNDNDFYASRDTLLSEKLFTDCLENKTDISTLVQQLKSVGINYNVYTDSCFIIELHIENMVDYLTSQWHYGKNRLYGAIRKIIPFESYSCYSIFLNILFDNIRILVLQKNGMQYEAITSIFEHIIFELKDCLNLSVSFSVASNAKSFEALKADINIMPDQDSIQDYSSDEADESADNIKTAENAVNKAIKYIEENYSDIITLEIISGYVHMNPTYFSTCFKNITGKKFIDHLSQFRINKAKELIDENPYIKVSTLCDAVGYKSSSYFYKAFLMHTGVSLSDYKKQLYDVKTEE